MANRWWRRGLEVAGLIVAGALALGMVIRPRQAGEAERAARAVAQRLAEAGPPQNRWDVYAHAFAGYALVNVHREEPGDAAILDRLIDALASKEASRAFSPERSLIEGHSLSTSVALVGHLALLLEARGQLGPMRPDLARFRDALLGWLSARVLAAPEHLLATEADAIYPADNEVLLAALTLAARRGAPSAAPAADALRTALDALSGHGLVPSRLADEQGGPDIPRGCALAYSAVFRAVLGDPHAADRYAALRAGFFDERGPLVGFREWPRGMKRRPDADSGPIILEFGASASAFGLAAARFEPGSDFTRLERTGLLARTLFVGGPRLRDLSEAIWSFALTARRW
jgi:hypothetical protein